MERSIRKTRRELVAKQTQIDSVAEMDVKSILQEDHDKLAARLARQNEAYNTFCDDNKLQPQYDRIKTAGFTRKSEKEVKEGLRRQQARENLANNVTSDIIDTKTSNGIQISNISAHSIERMAERKVTAYDIKQSLESPLHIGEIVRDNFGRPSQKFIGENATVNVNPDTGNITTVWKTGKATRRKYTKREE